MKILNKKYLERPVEAGFVVFVQCNSSNPDSSNVPYSILYIQEGKLELSSSEFEELDVTQSSFFVFLANVPYQYMHLDILKT